MNDRLYPLVFKHSAKIYFTSTFSYKKYYHVRYHQDIKTPIIYPNVALARYSNVDVIW